MNAALKKLIELTTIVKVENSNKETIFGDAHFRSRYERDQGSQLDLETIRVHWDNKWKSFGNNWTKERQNYRFFADSFQLFYYSFKQLRSNKVKGLYTDEPQKITEMNQFAGVNLYGVYHHGKKCIYILRKLNLIEVNNEEFCKKFSESRNKLIEHNFNPSGMNLQIDPDIFSLMETSSLLEIRIHEDQKEHTYTAYIDYYEDYYNLEKIFTDIIKCWTN